MEPEIVGERIKVLMRKYNLSKEKMAEKMVLDIKTSERKINGKEEFYLKEMLKIKEIFQLDDKSCDEIFFQETIEEL